MSSAEILARYLQSRAKAKHGFQADLARAMGASPTQIHEYVSGATIPSLPVLDRLAAAIGTSAWRMICPEQETAGDTRRSQLIAKIGLLADHDLRGVEALVDVLIPQTQAAAAKHKDGPHRE